ncbi:hypothetical protein M9H77_17730 [Catharanthus roseus]|uniref:Uncharacterized protein n=1 Tax=Catharanthus roseus TaxID=4058 RepID=A0ACC0B5F3_CATRO|nr:hypothetical protein M9H77_17730 [Catharanthus roseus]
MSDLAFGEPPSLPKMPRKSYRPPPASQTSSANLWHKWVHWCLMKTEGVVVEVKRGDVEEEDDDVSGCRRREREKASTRSFDPKEGLPHGTEHDIMNKIYREVQNVMGGKVQHMADEPHLDK